jgi:hypothetical protein
MSSARLRELAGGQERIKDLGLILGGDVTMLQERLLRSFDRFTHLEPVLTRGVLRQ